MGSPRADDGRREAKATRWCVVTGGRGFMARHLVAALLRSGWHVRVTDLAPSLVLGPGETEDLLRDALGDGRAVYASVDVCNFEQLTTAFEGVDVVFHTATADPIKNNLPLHYKVNVEGTKSVIDACKICKFPDAYTQTKAEAEKLVIKANDINDLLTCCLRPGSIFGPGDMVMPTLDSYGRTNFIIGDGKNCDDFVYVENVVYGHICADTTLSTIEGAKTSGGKAYFITNMEPINLWDFLHMVQEELGHKRLFTIRIPLSLMKLVSYLVEWAYMILHRYGICQTQRVTPARIKYMTLNRTFSCNRAVEELGYKPTVTLMDGLKIAVNSYIQSKNMNLS